MNARDWGIGTFTIDMLCEVMNAATTIDWRVLYINYDKNQMSNGSCNMRRMIGMQECTIAFRNAGYKMQ
jgi:hypothetical protein